MRAPIVVTVPLLVSCAAAQVAPRCPEALVAAVAAPPPAPAGRAVSELLARVPDGAEVVFRLDVERLFGTRLGRIVSPFLVWSREYAELRGACSERPWEVLRAVEGVYASEAFAAALLGPVAAENNACAVQVFHRDEAVQLRATSPAGEALVMGTGPLRPRLVDARHGEGSARDDAAFRELPPGMAEPIVTVLARGSAYLDLLDYVDTVTDQAARTQRVPPPRLNLATREALQTMRGIRFEVGTSASGDVDLDMTMVFPSASAAQGYVTAAAEDTRTRVPEYFARVLAQVMSENPEAERIGREVGPELTAWMNEMAPARADGAVVRYRLASSGTTLLGVGGALAAVAIPAFTRYTSRAKTAEATANVRTIAAALAAELERTPPARRRLTPIAATPAQAPGEARYAADATRWSTPAWRRVGFQIEGAHYYQYRVDVEGRCYVVVASGDLDGDHTLSRFSARVCPGAGGHYTAAETEVVDELE